MSAAICDFTSSSAPYSTVVVHFSPESPDTHLRHLSNEFANRAGQAFDCGDLLVASRCAKLADELALAALSPERGER